MTVDQFIHNNRKINEGKDLPPQYLANLYAAVRSCEIKACEENIAMHEDSSPPSIWRWKYVTQRLKGSVRASQRFLSSQRYHPLASLHISPLTILVCPSIVPLSMHVFPPSNPHHHLSPSCHSYSHLMGSVCRDALFTSSRPCSPMHQTLSPPYLPQTRLDAPRQGRRHPADCNLFRASQCPAQRHDHKRHRTRRHECRPRSSPPSLA